MGNPPEFSGPTGLQDSDLDDLPVRLLFATGRVELSLGELQRLAPGALVPLARPLDEPLDIMANGRRLGRRAVVQIGDSLGVRSVSRAGNDCRSQHCWLYHPPDDTRVVAVFGGDDDGLPEDLGPTVHHPQR